MRQAGRYLPEYREVRAKAGGFLDLCYTPELAAEVTLQPIERFGFDAAIIFSDILIIPHALGQDVGFAEGEGPVLEAISSADAVPDLQPGKFDGHMEPVYEALRLVRHKLPNEKTLIGFAGAPWTVATYMVEGGSSKSYLDVKRWAYGNPESFQKLIDVLVEATARHLVNQIDAGAEAVQIFDSWAGILPGPWLARYSVEPIREIIRLVRGERPAVPIIVFPKGIGAAYQSFAGDVRPDAVSLDTGVDAVWAAKHVQSGICVQGNLDPALLVTGGEAMRDSALDILEKFGSAPFVFNLGHGIVPETPPEHVGELVDLVHGWRRS